MDIELIKAMQRQLSVIGQVLASLAPAAGGRYELIQVERRSDWSDTPGRLVRIYLPDGPPINIPLVDCQVLAGETIELYDEPDSADREVIAHWLQRRLTAEVE